MTETVRPFIAGIVVDWSKDVHKYEPQEEFHRVEISDRYSVYSLGFDNLELSEKIPSINGYHEYSREINQISIEDGYLTFTLLDNSERRQIPIKEVCQ